ncbi:MAG: hypothetical protein H7Y18_20600 [Clostridiaceae bacterium]|nr:hypothetical protein [Clostridiaceae bacterium]
MKYHKDLIVGFIGAGSTVSAEIVTQVSVFLGFAKYSTYTLSSLLISGNRPSLILGLFVCPIVSSFIVTVLFHVFRKLGSKHLVLKCIEVSLLMWISLEFIFTIYFEGKLIPIRPMSAYYSNLIGAIIYGITVGVLMDKFVFEEPVEYSA